MAEHATQAWVSLMTVTEPSKRLQPKKTLAEGKKILVDGGYTDKPFAEKVKKILKAKTEIAKRNELKKFKVIPKRWVVERSFSWLEKCRRLWKNCERKLKLIGEIG